MHFVGGLSLPDSWGLRAPSAVLPNLSKGSRELSYFNGPVVVSAVEIAEGENDHVERSLTRCPTLSSGAHS